MSSDPLSCLSPFGGKFSLYFRCWIALKLEAVCFSKRSEDRGIHPKYDIMQQQRRPPSPLLKTDCQPSLHCGVKRTKWVRKYQQYIL
jgi:hypothetical protein